MLGAFLVGGIMELTELLARSKEIFGFEDVNEFKDKIMLATQGQRDCYKELGLQPIGSRGYERLRRA